MEATKDELVRCNDDVILLVGDNGEKLAIRTSCVTAVGADSESTTIYFQGNALRVNNPLNEVLVMVGFCKNLP